MPTFRLLFGEMPIGTFDSGHLVQIGEVSPQGSGRRPLPPRAPSNGRGRPGLACRPSNLRLDLFLAI